ncbi:hypothetical protein AB0I60_06185 [Actinosynnema sp. NPDC050436]|uniref:hypothetical protein n=1 Tax=Actinosynnema sp. NPDC050436 TaxID=3155659 RepID=UPI0033DFE6AA
MNTVGPAQARRVRLDRRRGSPAVPAGVASNAARHHLGRPIRPAFPVPLGLAAHTAGTWVSSREWLPPPAVSTQVDPVFHHDEQWSFWAWLRYHADWWVPSGMVLVTALVVLLVVRHTRRQAEAVAERDRLPAHGCRVPADVVEVRVRIATGEGGSHATGSTVTVSFVDLAGVRHWATRRTPDVGVPTGPASHRCSTTRTG